MAIARIKIYMYPKGGGTRHILINALMIAIALRDWTSLRLLVDYFIKLQIHGFFAAA